MSLRKEKAKLRRERDSSFSDFEPEQTDSEVGIVNYFLMQQNLSKSIERGSNKEERACYTEESTNTDRYSINPHSIIHMLNILWAFVLHISDGVCTGKVISSFCQ
jgi:hypothetical protein